MQSKNEIHSKLGQVKRVILFFLVYLAGFAFIENRNTQPHIIHTVLDDKIPFCEYFIIPYLMWFLLIALTLVYMIFFQENKKEYYQLMRNIYAGAIVFLIVSLVYPNAQDLRPELSGDGIFEKLVQLIYMVDTPTNILPSLHVFYAVACCIALLKTTFRKYGKEIKCGIVILTVLIILSTMFLKQHSVVDVVMALVLNVLFYVLFYRFIPVSDQNSKNRKIYI